MLETDNKQRDINNQNKHADREGIEIIDDKTKTGKSADRDISGFDKYDKTKSIYKRAGSDYEKIKQRAFGDIDNRFRRVQNNDTSF